MHHTHLTALDCELIGHRYLAENLVELVLSRPPGFDWQAGDYLFLGTEDESSFKPFSIAHGLHAKQLVLQIALTQALLPWWQQVQTRKFVRIKGPLSQYHWPTGQAPVFLLAGGTGITPLFALLKEQESDLAKRDVVLYWGVRHSSLLFAQTDLDRLDQRYPRFSWLAVVSGEDSDWQGARGSLPEFVQAKLRPVEQAHYLICGPWPMVQQIKHDLSERGVPETKIQ